MPRMPEVFHIWQDVTQYALHILSYTIVYDVYQK